MLSAPMRLLNGHGTVRPPCWPVPYRTGQHAKKDDRFLTVKKATKETAQVLEVLRFNTLALSEFFPLEVRLWPKSLYY
jgi:hypothetical protein